MLARHVGRHRARRARVGARLHRHAGRARVDRPAHARASGCTDADPAIAIGFGRALLRNIVWVLAASIVVGYFTPAVRRDAASARAGTTWPRARSSAIAGDCRARPSHRRPHRRPAPIADGARCPGRRARRSSRPRPRASRAPPSSDRAPRPRRDAAGRHDLARPRRHAGPARRTPTTRAARGAASHGRVRCAARSPTRRWRPRPARRPGRASAGCPAPWRPHAGRRRRRRPAPRTVAAARAARGTVRRRARPRRADVGRRHRAWPSTGARVYGRNPAREDGRRQRRGARRDALALEDPLRDRRRPVRRVDRRPPLDERHRRSCATAAGIALVAGRARPRCGRATDSSSATAAPRWACGIVTDRSSPVTVGMGRGDRRGSASCASTRTPTSPHRRSSSSPTAWAATTPARSPARRSSTSSRRCAGRPSLTIDDVHAAVRPRAPSRRGAAARRGCRRGHHADAASSSRTSTARGTGSRSTSATRAPTG